MARPPSGVPSRVAGAVLAAGSGRRMGEPKAGLVIDGARLIDRAVLALREAGCDPVYAVVRDGTPVPGAHVLVNPQPQRGQRSSLALAVSAAGDADVLAVLLVDAPGIGSVAVAAAVDAWTPGRIVIARYPAEGGTGRRGHPIVMAPALWRDAVELAGPDEGARALLRARADLVDEVPVPGDPTDLDTPQDVARWRAGG